MSREATAGFNEVNDADGADSRKLFEFTLRDGATTLYLSNAPATVGAQAYLPDVADPGEPRFSQGGNLDGLQLSLHNVDGAYGGTDETGASPLEGARVCFKKAVSRPGEHDWQVDTIGYGQVLAVQADPLVARLEIVSDMNDPTAVVSGEIVLLEELTPVAAEGDGGGGDGGGLGDLGDRGNGWGGNTYYDHLRDRRLDRDWQVYLV